MLSLARDRSSARQRIYFPREFGATFISGWCAHLLHLLTDRYDFCQGYRSFVIARERWNTRRVWATLEAGADINGYSELPYVPRMAAIP